MDFRDYYRTLDVSSDGNNGEIRKMYRKLAWNYLPDINSDAGAEVSFASHPLYRIDGRDLYLELPVAPFEAALVQKVATPTPGSKVDLQTPKKARRGQKLRLKGKALPGTPPGDFYVTIGTVNPKVATEEARALCEQLAGSIPFDRRAGNGA